MNLKDVLIDNYIPYAKGVIMGRAIPGIDGCKPVVRRILYVMHKNNLYNQNKKCQSIVGDTMKIHPNGDAAIYEALVRLSTGNGALNVPYIQSKGNFGKFYSKQIAYAAPRYTEARLSDAAALLFDGIDEDAVDMKPNYDSTAIEPELLPVKFPNIIVNNTEGIAVAMSSAIPCFGLIEACKAVIGIMSNQIKDEYDLASVLVAPEFPTGGSVHLDRKQFVDILKTGKGSLTATGHAEMYSNKIVIDEVPYGVKIEDLLADINNDTDNFKDVSKAINLTGREGMRLEVILKRGANPEEVYNKLVRYSKFRTTISFNTSVIIGNKCRNDIGIMELLHEWINFRLETIRRIYSFRLNKKKKLERTLQVWEKIKGSIKDVTEIITGNSEEVAINTLKKKYSLDDEQANSLMNMRIKDLTTDRLISKLKELEETRQEIKSLTEIVNDPEKRKEISIRELTDIINKFGKNKGTQVKEPIIIEKTKKEKPVISKEPVKIVITKKTNVKRIMYIEAEPNIDTGDPIVKQMICGNDQYLLIFTNTGYCYRVAINDIDCNAKTAPNTYLYSLISLVDQSEIVYVGVTSETESGKFNVIYPNGKFEEVFTNRFNGNRKVYKAAFTGAEKRSDMQIMAYDKFFVLTDAGRMMYIDASNTISSGRLITRRTGTLKLGESVIGGIPVNRVTNIEEIDLSNYSKGRFVKKRDELKLGK